MGASPGQEIPELLRRMLETNNLHKGNIEKIHRNLIHSQADKLFQPLCRSAQTQVCVQMFDAAYLRINDFKTTHGVELTIYMYSNSLQLFDVLMRGRRINEGRLTIDILAAIKSYKKYEVAGVGDITGINNPTDVLTVTGHREVLDKLTG